MFRVTGSPLTKARGQNVTIFYFNKLGYYPQYTSQEIPVSGGWSQNFSLQTHLEKGSCDINYSTPAKDFRGLAAIDWEYWSPQWDCDWDAKDVYRRKARKLISQMEGIFFSSCCWTLSQIFLKKKCKSFYEGNSCIRNEKQNKGPAGMLFNPDCHNCNFCVQKCSGSCLKSEVLGNNELPWLWDGAAALYPSISIKKLLGSSENILHFSEFMVSKSIRIFSMTSKGCVLPVFVYSWLGYGDEPLFFFLCRKLLLEQCGLRLCFNRSCRWYIGMENLQPAPALLVHVNCPHAWRAQCSEEKMQSQIPFF